jgi:hypothetical protein
MQPSIEIIVAEHMKADELNQQKINRVLFGDTSTGDVGMKEKVDDIHQMLIQVNGVGNFLKWIIVCGASLAAIKLWIIK